MAGITPLPFSDISSGYVVTTQPAGLGGWCLRNSISANPSTMQIVDGKDSSGQVVAEIDIPPGDTQVEILSPPGINCLGGIFIDVLAGEVTGVIYSLTIKSP